MRNDPRFQLRAALILVLTSPVVLAAGPAHGEGASGDSGPPAAASLAEPDATSAEASAVSWARRPTTPTSIPTTS
jgi:hypothetical protein